MRGWKVRTSENPYSYLAEKGGFTVTSVDGKKFDVKDPEGKPICVGMNTSLEAHRLAEAALNRTMGAQPPIQL